jgi:tRNA nucleotidyltransferase (CCA-adding enzyme)
VPAEATTPRDRLGAVLALRRDPVVERVAEHARGLPCHLVGGVLRDAWLGRPCHDVDVVVSGDGRRLALDLAEALPARFVHLGGKAFAAFRLVGDGFEVDLWDRETMSFEADLARRDLTVNALALDLHPPVPDEPPVDLFGGLADLEARRLRATTAESFTDDPLRVLRLPRFQGELAGFTAETATLELARASAAGLLEVARERVRDEVERLFAVTAPDGFEGAAKTLREAGITAVLVGGEGTDRPDGPSPEGWTAFGRAAAWAQERGETVGLLPGRLALWAGRDGLDRLEERGHVTREVARRARTVADGADGAAALGASPVLDVVAARRFLHGAGSLWPTAWAVSVATTPGEDPADERAIFSRLRDLAATHGDNLFDPPRLLSGGDLQQLFGLAPGPRLGEVLASVRRAQVEGVVTSRAEAEAHVASLLETLAG